MALLIVLTICIAVIAGAPRSINGEIPQRITGGSLTTINQYPDMAVLLYSSDRITFTLDCGGFIINNRSIISAAFCVQRFPAPDHYRFRVGSTYASSGGVVHHVNFFIFHPRNNPFTLEADIVIIRSFTTITFNNVVTPAYIAGTNYNVGDNAVVWTAGWGTLWPGVDFSEQLRHVQLYTVNQNVCAQRYATIGRNTTDDKLCAGLLDVGGAGPCMRDAGAPLYYNGVVVGVFSFSSGSAGCGDPFFPGVYSRVSSFTTWIQTNA